MRDRMPNQVRLGVTLLRVAVASVFVIHGTTRLMNAGVGGFGGFIGSWGLPAGVALAWAITVIEVLGGLSLAATDRKYADNVRLLSPTRMLVSSSLSFSFSSASGGFSFPAK